jgi:hypothetical protein
VAGDELIPGGEEVIIATCLGGDRLTLKTRHRNAQACEEGAARTSGCRRPQSDTTLRNRRCITEVTGELQGQRPHR